MIPYMLAIFLQGARRSISSTTDDTTLIRFGGMISYLAVSIFDTGKYWTYVSDAILKCCY